MRCVSPCHHLCADFLQKGSDFEVQHSCKTDCKTTQEWHSRFENEGDIPLPSERCHSARGQLLPGLLLEYLSLCRTEEPERGIFIALFSFKTSEGARLNLFGKWGERGHIVRFWLAFVAATCRLNARNFITEALPWEKSGRRRNGNPVAADRLPLLPGLWLSSARCSHLTRGGALPVGCSCREDALPSPAFQTLLGLECTLLILISNSCQSIFLVWLNLLRAPNSQAF